MEKEKEKGKENGAKRMNNGMLDIWYFGMDVIMYLPPNMSRS